MKNGKVLLRALALILAALLLLGTAGGPVYADEVTDSYEETDSFVLLYYKKSSTGTYTYGLPYQYFSPYTARIRTGTKESNVQTMVFSLYDTTTGTVIPVFCTDAHVKDNSNSNYRRLNLEDSTYCSAGAGRLRSVMLNGFPNTSVEEIAKAANIEGLTLCQVLHAQQLAIRKVNHGSEIEILDYLNGLHSRDTWNSNVFPLVEHANECFAEFLDEDGNEVYPASVDEIPKVEANVEALCNYFLGLEPTAPAEVTVSARSFVSWSDAPVVTANDDGTCNVKVEAVVNVKMKDGDALTLSAVLGDGTYYAEKALADGTNTVTLTIENVPADVAAGDVTLAIDGVQRVCDVFLYDAVGARGTSQSMVGVSNLQLPVHAEVTVEQERILNIYKLDKTDNTGLEGVQFDIYFVADRDAYLSGEVELPEPRDYEYSGLGDYTIITDANGFGSFNLTRNGMADGVYLVVERDHPAIVAPVDPFYVILPATSADGSELEYVVDVYPKNELYNDVDIEKDVISLGNDSATEDAYAVHTWIIGANIPRDIANGKRYVISDTLDNRLDFKGNVKVRVESLDGTTVLLELVEGQDYTLTYQDVDSLSEGEPSDSFSVSLTSVGMAKVGGAVGTSFSDYKLRVWFDAQINANAALGVEIPNQATLEYTNSVGTEYDAESDKPEVHTGGTLLKKVDANAHTVVLPGAEFQVYRKATAAESGDETVEKVYINGMVEPMVQVTFFNRADLTGDKTDTAISDENGKIYIYGLAYGTYYLVETKAPAGYNLMGEPFELTVTAESHLEANAATVENVSGSVLPETGGMGIHVPMGAGVMLMAAAFVLMKRRNSAA